VCGLEAAYAVEGEKGAGCGGRNTFRNAPERQQTCAGCADPITAHAAGAVAADLIAVALSGTGTPMCVECTSAQAQVWCTKCQVALCKQCHRVTHASRLFQNHALERMEDRGDRPRPMPRCPAHPNEFVSFIARDGVTLLCRDCVLIGESAGGAPADLVEGAIPLRDAAMAARMRIGSVVDFTEQRAAQVRDMQRAVAEVVPQVQADHTRLAANISEKAETLSASVDARHDALRRMVIDWKEREVLQSDKLLAQLRVMHAALRNAARVSTTIAQRTDELGALQVMGEVHPHLTALCSQTVPTIHDYPISPVPTPDSHSHSAAAQDSMGEVGDSDTTAARDRGRRAMHATADVSHPGDRPVSSAFLPAGLHGKQAEGVLCALGWDFFV
jgi:hypothetical protein